MSTLDVVAEVLREAAPRALKAREIAVLAGHRLPTASRTPETVVSRDLALDVRDLGASSRFLRVDRGAFVLKEALPTAFYNDNDSYAAQWTRNLIAAGEIAAGVVDERSIRDLKPTDVAGYRQCHFFSGIGVWSRALQEAGWPDDVPIWSGSAPCQPWSSAGKRRGSADERHLWPEWFRLIRECGPPVIIGEQVASKDGYCWLDAVATDLEKIGYSVSANEISAAATGAPHRRQRIYFVAVLLNRQEVLKGLLSAGSNPSRMERTVDDISRAPRGNVKTSAPESGLHALHTRLEDEANAPRTCCGHDLFHVETARDPGLVAYASERGREILSAPWLHDRGQPGDDATRCIAPHGSVPPAIPCDAGAHGETDGGADELGDTDRARSRWDPRKVRPAQEVGKGEWVENGTLAHEPIAPVTTDSDVESNNASNTVEMVRGAVTATGNGSMPKHDFRPGDCIRLDDPSWGGAVRGFWADSVEWIYCRPEPGHEDGRWRPVESGTLPLVDGTAPRMGRTRSKRLRCLGNAIVRPVAVAFVEAVIESFTDAACVSNPHETDVHVEKRDA